MAEPMRLFYESIATPIGTSIIVCDDQGSLRLHYWDDEDAWKSELARRYGNPVLERKRDPFGSSGKLRDYFAGDIAVIDTLAVTFTGTPFQNKVWKALRKIPGGTTLSYGALAKKIGEPKAVRAVGLANGSNPVGVIVPCHRVIGSNGALTGYGGGLPRKRWLLEHEARHAGTGLFAKEAAR